MNPEAQFRTRRRSSRPIHIGAVAVGGDAPIVVQSMTNSDTRDAAATVGQILELEEAGCELVRVAVPDFAAAEAIAAIKNGIHIPLIADIHFDYRLALAALKTGADALRLNPGNIRDPDRVRAVVRAASERSAPIRIGVNAGSLPREKREAGSGKREGGRGPGARDRESTVSDRQSVITNQQSEIKNQKSEVAERMVEAALGHIAILEGLDFDLIKVSLKAFDVPTTVEAYRLIADRVPYPLHLGITEAGTSRAGVIRSAVGLGILLHEGLGDTIRVSLTAHPREEVFAAYEILKSLNLRQRGPTLVSCPSCGRAEIDLISLANAVEERLAGMTRPIKVAVMGCVVNGPGEAREADVGIAGGKGRGVLFRKGEILRVVEEADCLEALLAEIERL
ncbi:MAG: flavodoxin-dependent (E)-4-hydroxy-3-methylbut-2-enyl-diphosphate synthase [Chloroflexi bacterium]|nr:flavodoxin-dependent (E)-4-hydroxy-3-methylbut-2-enyl-diphosphate synthase [Chloroflexota bacterium]